MVRIATASSTEVLAGVVDRVTFHNSESGFCVLRVKARRPADPITVVGHAAMISAGEFVQASGWINGPTHGVQFRAAFLKARAPTMIEGIEKYLGSGMIRGIGPVYAKKLCARLWRRLLEVPAELVETALGLELQDGTVIADDVEGCCCIFLAGLYRAEREIAAKLKALRVRKPPWPLIDAGKAIPWV